MGVKTINTIGATGNGDLMRKEIFYLKIALLSKIAKPTTSCVFI
jgi:hypothetical protein